jgi:hypothetical protein
VEGDKASLCIQAMGRDTTMIIKMGLSILQHETLVDLGGTCGRSWFISKRVICVRSTATASLHADPARRKGKHGRADRCFVWMDSECRAVKSNVLSSLDSSRFDTRPLGPNDPTAYACPINYTAVSGSYNRNAAGCCGTTIRAEEPQKWWAGTQKLLSSTVSFSIAEGDPALSLVTRPGVCATLS